MKAPHQVPYHRAIIGDEEIAEVVATLRSGWLTAGPRVRAFEEKFSAYKGGVPCVAVNSCTAGMFLALKSLDFEPGDEVITTPMTFVATANVITHAGAEVRFADIDPETMNIDPAAIERAIGPKTKAILPVHLGGNPCDMAPIMALAEAHGLKVIEDCAHAVEGLYGGKALGTFGYAGAFSFYATKNITTAEGGMITCEDEAVERICRLLSRHGVDKGTWERMEVEGTPLYDVVVPGYKCNLTDLQAALGLHQMDRMLAMYQRRVEIYERYEAAFGSHAAFETLRMEAKGKSALHLYMLLLNPDFVQKDRQDFIAQARDRGVELSVNYTPIHLFSYYRNRFCAVPGAFKHAEYCGANVISLPFYPAMTDRDVDYVIEVLTDLVKA